MEIEQYEAVLPLPLKG